MLLRLALRLAFPPAAFAGIVGATGGGAAALPPDAAGVNGVAVGAIHYRLDPADPLRVDGVSFALRSGAVGSVRVRLGRAGGRWVPCAVAAGRADCPTSAPLARIDSLEIAAAT